MEFCVIFQIYRLQDEQKVSKSPVIPQISEQETKLLQQRVKQLEKMLSESQTNANIISNHDNSSKEGTLIHLVSPVDRKKSPTQTICLERWAFVYTFDMPE